MFWRVGTSATLNGVNFRGNVLADASITVGDGANVSGKLLAGTGPTGAFTLTGSGGNTVGGCVASAPPAAIPTLGFYAMALLLILLAAVGAFRLSS